MNKKLIIKCKKCKKETEHADSGKDIPENKRYYCKICRTCNNK
jgi:hypothetical protein